MDQIAHSVQSDHDLPYPLKLLLSSLVRKELTLNRSLPTFKSLNNPEEEIL